MKTVYVFLVACAVAVVARADVADMMKDTLDDPSQIVHGDDVENIVANIQNSMFRGAPETEELEPRIVIRVHTEQRMPRLKLWTFTSHFNAPEVFPVGGPSGLFQNFFGDQENDDDRMQNIFSGLFDNTLFDMISKMRMRLRNEYDLGEEEETPAEEDVREIPEAEKEQDEWHEVETAPVSSTKDDEKIEELEELKQLNDRGFLEADWGVNVAQLRDACMTSFVSVCPASVPQVFYDDIHRFPPPGVPMMGLAPADHDAHCWMDCVKQNFDALPYDCRVSADRMMSWIQVHGSDAEYVEPPQALFFGALLHFLVLTLLIFTCVRCVTIFCRIRRQRFRARAARTVADEKGMPVVKAITIQIPGTNATIDEHVTLVQGTVVTDEK